MQRFSHNHRKVPIVYCSPRFRNILAVHLLGAFSPDPESKYITSGTQKRFVPSPRACLAYQPHRSFSAYLADSGRISVIADKLKIVSSLIPDHFHSPLSINPYPPLRISPFNLIASIPIYPSDKLPSFIQYGRY